MVEKRIQQIDQIKHVQISLCVDEVILYFEDT